MVGKFRVWLLHSDMPSMSLPKKEKRKEKEERKEKKTQDFQRSFQCETVTYIKDGLDWK